MKKITILLFCFLLVDGLFAQETDYCKVAEMMTKTIQQLHIKKTILSEDFKTQMANLFVESIDPDAEMIAEEDANLIHHFIQKLNPRNRKSNCQVLDKITEHFSKILEERVLLIGSLQDADWGVDSTDFYFFKIKDEALPREEMVLRWKKRMLFDVFYLHKNTLDSTNRSAVISPQSYLKLKREILDRELCRIEVCKNYTDGLKGFVANNYLNAMATAYDPHTQYFSATDKNYFEDQLSDSDYSFGFEFMQNRVGEAEVIVVTDDGPAWKSNKLKVGDVIVSIQEEGGELIKVDCHTMVNFLMKIYDTDTKKLTFTIRNKENQFEEISLEKSKMDVVENEIESYIINGSNKIGYLYLPSFYTKVLVLDSIRGASDDIRIVLEKFKEEKVEGLIFDLRNNSGGSIIEFVKIAGMFINYGALGIVDYGEEMKEVIYDQEEGLLFSAPMVILQNKSSASASEFFSGTMQNYSRAVIVGDTTYGKATIQEIIPVDYYKESAFRKEEVNFVKLTIGRFYRVDRTSNQVNGVVPDIQFPQSIFQRYIGERNSSNPIANDTIDRHSNFQPFRALPINTLNKWSQARRDSSKYFKEIKYYNEKIDSLFLTPIFMTPNSFYQYIKKKNALSLDTEKTVIYEASFLDNKDILNSKETSDDLKKKKLDIFLEDRYIEESYLIIKDLISLGG